MDRISSICSYLDRCRVFADVGCDHGYCTRYMLVNDLCERAVISDISAKSLKKAQTALEKYSAEGRVTSVCCDGLYMDEEADEVLIAGMGGEEIIKILRQGYIPRKFILQPMKNAETLRAFLLERGCGILRDDIFTDGNNFYFIIKGERTGAAQTYSEAQLAFGRDSLDGDVLKDYLRVETGKIEGYLQRPLSEESRSALIKRYNFLKGVHSGEIV